MSNGITEGWGWQIATGPVCPKLSHAPVSNSRLQQLDPHKQETQMRPEPFRLSYIDTAES